MPSSKLRCFRDKFRKAEHAKVNALQRPEPDNQRTRRGTDRPQRLDHQLIHLLPPEVVVRLGRRAPVDDFGSACNRSCDFT